MKIKTETKIVAYHMRCVCMSCDVITRSVALCVSVCVRVRACVHASVRVCSLVCQIGSCFSCLISSEKMQG